MILLAGEWYDNGTFWTAMVTLFVGLLAAWAQLKGNNPKLRLGCELVATTDLLGPAGANGLTVTHNGATLTSPHIALVTIANEGRRDIEGSMFPNGDPLLLDLGEPALGVLDVQSGHPSAPAPPVTVAAGKVALTATHFPRKQKVQISVVLDGPTGGVLAITGSLVNGEVRNRSKPPKPWWLETKFLIFATLISAWLIFGMVQGGQ
ncbi:hypothetical protein ACH4FV_02015 [Streptomyces anulatus]|uniref:hypothetical protein n=1 Tax=Streptomyces anulatus TaxID=1892 RepID=UPI0022503A60|nr:hypothetical protein [Streptomyces anulatus]MCX4520992.1 hypothetical protein [Streptomyces anulatus]MCX4603862.1 hypothetical protein [Streptomyces anulatus]WSU76086.1 hypothetical protein OG499_25480 [Streptomyces anulatus]WTD12464.1 hypothetical protein OHA54_25945 [Streptomyces anulatus]WTE05775.1 hypothetical protein OH765_26050 [Streptomyces anulatus]